MQAIPVLPCPDLEAAVSFYRSRGLEVHDEGPDYSVIRWGGHDLLHLRAVIGLDPTANPSMVFIHVDDPDRWHHELTSRGIVASPPRDEPWGVREFSFTDPARTTIRVGRALDDS